MMQANSHPQPLQRYRVRLRSHLNSSWLSSFPVVRMTAGYDTAHKPVTMLIVSMSDQAELMGMLMELHGLGLTLLSVQTITVSRKGSAGGNVSRAVGQT
jgi:hypothetical protein